MAYIRYLLHIVIMYFEALGIWRVLEQLAFFLLFRSSYKKKNIKRKKKKRTIQKKKREKKKETPPFIYTQAKKLNELVFGFKVVK